MTERMNRYPKIVVSRTLTNAQWAPSTLLSGKPLRLGQRAADLSPRAVSSAA
jgi:hypothetical protein